ACAAADAVLSHGLACTLGELLHRAAVVADATTVGVGVSVANDEPGGPAASRSGPLPEPVAPRCRPRRPPRRVRPAAASAIAAATLARGIDALLDDAGSIASAGGADDGVRAEEVLEAALACLHSLARRRRRRGRRRNRPDRSSPPTRGAQPAGPARLCRRIGRRRRCRGSSCVGPAGDLLERLATANAATGSTSATLQRSAGQLCRHPANTYQQEQQLAARAAAALV
uniref:DUF4116 domain-containing protein n=1 Tax=Macrostomum lignano TaxID=282301 RepID=A0A1I8FQN6_9PLAT